MALLSLQGHETILGYRDSCSLEMELDSIALKRGMSTSGFVVSLPFGFIRTSSGRHRFADLPRNRGTTTISRRVVTTAKSSQEVLIVGAGVIGLTTAIRLREAGFQVSILAEESPSTILSRKTTPWYDTPPATYTSSGSGGLWMPFLLEGDDVKEWATETHNVYQRHANDDIGVRILEGFIVHARTVPELPWYAKLVSMEVITPKDDSRVPPDYRAALRFTTPVVQMELYLPYLEQTVSELGIPLILTREHTMRGKPTAWDLRQVLDYATQQYGETPTIVNCCGLGARYLSDDTLIPVRGVTRRVKRPPHVKHFISEAMDDGFMSKEGLVAYAIPRGDEMTLGGTVYRNDWSEVAEENVVNGVHRRASRLVDVVDAEETGRWSGLRPVREDGNARVEVEETNGVTMIANYGHGGSGVTTCWGCASHVVRLLQALPPR